MKIGINRTVTMPNIIKAAKMGERPFKSRNTFNEAHLVKRRAIWRSIGFLEEKEKGRL
jgi:hypothetical protein